MKLTDHQLKKLRSAYRVFRSHRSALDEAIERRDLLVKESVFQALAQEVEGVEEVLPGALPPLASSDHQLQGMTDPTYGAETLHAYLLRAVWGIDAVNPAPEQYLRSSSDYGLADCADLVDSCRELLWQGHVSDTARIRIPAFLVVRDVSLASTAFPSDVAHYLFGDSRRVYDLKSRLLRERAPVDGIVGSPPGLDPSRGSLHGFIKEGGPCVVVVDDIQTIDPDAMLVLGEMCEHAAIGRFNETSVEGCVLLASVRVDVPGIHELHRQAPEGMGIPVPTVGWCKKNWLTPSVLEALLPQCSTKIWSRFYFHVFSDLEELYATAKAADRLHEPLLTVRDPNAAVWKGPPPVPPPDPSDLVSDVRYVMPADQPEKRYDVFIGYRVARNKTLAESLARQLKSFMRVWIDTESLELDQNSASFKSDLIRELVLAVRSSHCSIIFALGARRFYLPEGWTEEQALKHGLAMRGADGHLGQWNWQQLELEQSSVALVIDELNSSTHQSAYGYIHEQRDYADWDELMEIVMDYVRSRGLLPDMRALHGIDESMRESASEQMREGRLAAAIQTMSEGVDTYRLLRRWLKWEIEAQLAWALNTLGSLLVQREDLPQALDVAREADSLLEECAEPEDGLISFVYLHHTMNRGYKPHLLSSKLLLSTTLKRLGLSGEAIEVAERAIEIALGLCLEHDQYLADLGAHLGNVGQWSMDLEDARRARRYILLAMEILICARPTNAEWLRSTLEAYESLDGIPIDPRLRARALKVIARSDARQGESAGRMGGLPGRVWEKIQRHRRMRLIRKLETELRSAAGAPSPS